MAIADLPFEMVQGPDHVHAFVGVDKKHHEAPTPCTRYLARQRARLDGRFVNLVDVLG